VISEALDQQLPVALDAQPTVVTVWLAVNDLKNGVSLRLYERDLNVLLMELKSTGATVLVGNMPDLTSLPLSDAVLQAYGTPSRVALHAEIARWNASIARIASRHGLSSTLQILLAELQFLHVLIDVDEHIPPARCPNCGGGIRLQNDITSYGCAWRAGAFRRYGGGTESGTRFGERDRKRPRPWLASD